MISARNMGVIVAILLSTSPAVAQIFNPAMMAGEPASYRAVNVSIPAITLTKENVGRVEFNLSGQGALGIEGVMMKKRQEIGEEETKETGESILAQGQEALLLISRYSSGSDMSGFFWSLGVGLREERLLWHVQPDNDDPEADFSLVDENNLFYHSALAKGTTGHIRIGYRYIGDSLPIAAGIYGGVRHFQAKVSDAAPSKGMEDEAGNEEQDPMTDREKEHIRRSLSTAPEAGLEIGFAF